MNPTAHHCESAVNLAHLLRSLHADLVMVFQAYCDESGTDAGSRITCVAGYIFDPAQLVRFEDEWSATLDHFGVECFHMSDCAHGTGEFSKLSPVERSELAKQCIGIIKRRARTGVVASLDQQEFRQFATPNGFHDAYVACAVWCVGGIVAWAEKYANGQRIAYFFESGAKLQHRASEAIAMSNKIPGAAPYYNSHSFIGKKDAKAIQAADLLAWEWQKEMRAHIGQPRRTRRRSFRSLLEAPHIYCHLTRDHLLGLINGRQDEDLRRYYPLGPNDHDLMVVEMRKRADVAE